jgi:hypothetical protein
MGFIALGAANQAKIAGTLAHIEGCARCRRLVGEAARVGGESAPGARTAAVAVGERLADRYEILARVSVDAALPHGEVSYDALDHQREEMVTVRTFAPEIAPLPQPRPSGATTPPTLAAAAEALTRVLALVRHPHLRRVLDGGVHRRTTGLPARAKRSLAIPFVVLELVEGEPLDQWVAARGPVPAAEAGAMVAQLAGALSALHRAGGAERGGFEARHLVAGENGLVLDPLSPARLLGDAGDGVGADIAAVGTVMFLLLAGRPPTLEGEPMPPRLLDLVPDADPAWEQAISRCLAPRGSRRFRQVEEIPAALGGAGPGRRAARWLRGLTRWRR